MQDYKRESQYEKVPTKELFDSVPEKPDSYGYGIRHLQAALLLLSLTVSYIARAHVSLTVVAMSIYQNDSKINVLLNRSFYDNTTQISEINNYYNGTVVTESEINDYIFFKESTTEISSTYTSIFDDDTKESIATESEINDTISKSSEHSEISASFWNVYRSYEWDKLIQEMIIDSFSLGYFLMMFPMGMIAQRFGGKIPLQLCMLVNGLVCLVTPSVAAWGGWKAVCFCRVLQGLSQAGLYPSIQTVLSKWAPVSERGTLTSVVFAGSTIGTVIGFQSSGALCSSKAGWPATFWLYGVISIGTFIVLTIFGAATPTDYKKLGEKERNFILGTFDDGAEKKKKFKTPWKKILSSKPVWGAFAAHAASGVCFVFFFTQIPTYMVSILRFNIKSSGILSSLPYIASIILSVVYGMISDYCVNRGHCSLKTARMVSNSIAQVGPALCLVAVSFTEIEALAVILLIFGVGLLAGVHVGWMVNYIDLAPNFSGPLMATGNTMTALGCLAQPVLISNIVTDVSHIHTIASNDTHLNDLWLEVASLPVSLGARQLLDPRIFKWIASLDKYITII